MVSNILILLNTDCLTSAIFKYCKCVNLYNFILLHLLILMFSFVMSKICSKEYGMWTCIFLGAQAELSVIALDLTMVDLNFC